MLNHVKTQPHFVAKQVALQTTTCKKDEARDVQQVARGGNMLSQQ